MKELLLQFSFLGIRAALVDNGQLTELIVEPPEPPDIRFGDIFQARVKKLLPALGAALVDVGLGQTALLQTRNFPLCETLKIQPLRNGVLEFGTRYAKVVLKEDLQLIVQVRRPPRDHKAALVSPYITVEDFFLALRPGTSSFRWPIQCSREWKEQTLALLAPIAQRVGGFVLGRRALYATSGELLEEANRLRSNWRHIVEQILTAASPGLVYSERNSIARILREIADGELDEICLDAPQLKDSVQQCWSSLARDHPAPVSVHAGAPDLFARRRIDDQLRIALQPEVPLPRGGLARFEPTTAGTLVDVDIALARSGAGFGAPKVSQVNTDAAYVIARQLRLRALGGKILVDFIDPGTAELRKQLRARILPVFFQDRLVNAAHMHPGCALLDVHRQRRRPSLADQFLSRCPECGSRCQIWSVSAQARDLLYRALSQSRFISGARKVLIEAPPNLVDYFRRVEPSLLQQFTQAAGIPVEVQPLPSEEPRVSIVTGD